MNNKTSKSFTYFPNKLKRYLRYLMIIFSFIMLLWDSEGREIFVRAITFNEFNKHSIVIMAMICFGYITTIELFKFKAIVFKDNFLKIPTFQYIYIEENVDLNEIIEIQELRSEIFPGICLITNSNKRVFVNRSYMRINEYEDFKKFLEQATSKKISIIFDARSMKN